MLSEEGVKKYRDELLVVLNNLERQESDIRCKLFALDIVLGGES